MREFEIRYTFKDRNMIANVKEYDILLALLRFRMTYPAECEVMRIEVRGYDKK